MDGVSCLADGVEPGQRGADGQAGEARLGDGRVDDALLPEPVQEALGHLVRSVVLGNLLAEQEDLVIGGHLLGHGLVEGVTDRHHLGAIRCGGEGACSWRDAAG